MTAILSRTQCQCIDNISVFVWWSLCVRHDNYCSNIRSNYSTVRYIYIIYNIAFCMTDIKVVECSSYFQITKDAHTSPSQGSLNVFCKYLGEKWLNSLWSSDVIWRQGSRSTLAQVMACCLTAPSHYLNQCWLMISEVLWHSPDSNFTENASNIYCWNEFEIY